MANQTDRLVVEMSKKLKQKFKEKVASEGRTMKFKVEGWISSYVKGDKED